MIAVDKINNFEAVATLKEIWHEILGKSDVNTIFSTPDWLGVWWKVFGADKELYLLHVKSEGASIGFAPFMITHSGDQGNREKVLEFIGAPNIDYADIIAEDKIEVWKFIWQYLDQHRNDWTRINLSQIPENSSSLQYFHESFDIPLKVINPIETCYAYEFEGSEDERSKFSFKKSKTAKSAINVFQKEGGLVAERITDPAACRKYLFLLFHFHVVRWDETPTPSKFLEEKNRRFYLELLESLNPENICFFIVRKGATPVAMSFNFEYNKSMYYYTLAINQYLRKRSPGQLLFALQGESFIKHGYRLDYSRGAQEYKNTFSNRSAQNYEVTIFSRAADFKKSRLISRMKQSAPFRKILTNPKIQPIKIKISSELQKNGFKGVALKLVRKIGEFFNRYIIDYRQFFVFRFDGTTNLDLKPGIPITVRQLSMEDIEQLASFYGSWDDSPKYRAIVERFEKKADCWAAFHLGNLVAVTWGLFHTDVHGELGLTLSPRENEILYTDVWASPIYRGMKISPVMVGQHIDDCRRRGLTPIAGIAATNKSSLRAFSIFGLTKIRTIKYLRIFNIRIM